MAMDKSALLELAEVLRSADDAEFGYSILIWPHFGRFLPCITGAK